MKVGKRVSERVSKEGINKICFFLVFSILCFFLLTGISLVLCLMKDFLVVKENRVYAGEVRYDPCIGIREVRGGIRGLRRLPDRELKKRLWCGMREAVRKYGRYGIDFRVLFALIKVESGGRFFVRGRAGDYGIFQINWRTLRELGLSRYYAYDPYYAAQIAAWRLAKCFVFYKHRMGEGRLVSFIYAIECYNKGERGSLKFYRKKKVSNYVLGVIEQLKRIRLFSS